MKGGIFMPKGKPNKRYTAEFKIKVIIRVCHVKETVLIMPVLKTFSVC